MSKGLKGFQKGHKGFRKKITVKRRCKFCNKDIFIVPYLLKIESGKFCNMECYAKWQSQNRRLKNSYTWKGGSEVTYRNIARKIIKDLSVPLVCITCGRKKSIIIHHIDKNVKNNIRLNLMVLCQSCHVNLHYKIEHKTKKDRARNFKCQICYKEFSVNTKKERKVCSLICSFEYSKKGLSWLDRRKNNHEN